MSALSTALTKYDRRIQALTKGDEGEVVAFKANAAHLMSGVSAKDLANCDMTDLSRRLVDFAALNICPTKDNVYPIAFTSRKTKVTTITLILTARALTELIGRNGYSVRVIPITTNDECRIDYFNVRASIIIKNAPPLLEGKKPKTLSEAVKQSGLIKFIAIVSKNGVDVDIQEFFVEEVAFRARKYCKDKVWVDGSLTDEISPNNPWVSDFTARAKTAVFKRVCTPLPLTSKDQSVLQANSVDVFDEDDSGGTIDVDFSEGSDTQAGSEIMANFNQHVDGAPVADMPKDM